MVAVFDVVGGIGTVCAAFFTENYPSLSALLDYKWLYQIFVVVTILFGLLGIWVTVDLIRGTKNAYRNTLWVLGTGVLFYAIRVYASQTLRGNAAPTNINWYFHIIVLVYFLLFKLPGLRDHVKFSKSKDQPADGVSGGLTAIVTGLFIATSTMLVASTHTYHGVNWADILRVPFGLIGAGLIVSGIYLLGSTIYRTISQKAWQGKVSPSLAPAKMHR